MPQLARLPPLVRSLTGVDVRSVGAWWASGEQRDRDEPGGSGPPANRRLTALTGALVLPLAGLVLLSGLFFGSVWRVHYFLGYLLLPIVLLKIGSTTYRMARYYLRSGRYRWVRPPYPLGRITSPLLVLSVIVLFVSGIAMWLTHSRRDPWGFLHTDAAVVFCALVLLHLVLYLPEALGSVWDAVRRPASATSFGRTSRSAVIGAAVLTGLLLALLTVAPSRLPARGHRPGGEVSVEHRGR